MKNKNRRLRKVQLLTDDHSDFVAVETQNR